MLLLKQKLTNFTSDLATRFHTNTKGIDMIKVEILIKSSLMHDGQNWPFYVTIEKMMPAKPDVGEEIFIISGEIVVEKVIHHFQTDSIEVVCKRVNYDHICKIHSFAIKNGNRIVFGGALIHKEIAEIFESDAR